MLVTVVIAVLLGRRGLPGALLGRGRRGVLPGRCGLPGALLGRGRCGELLGRRGLLGGRGRGGVLLGRGRVVRLLLVAHLDALPVAPALLLVFVVIVVVLLVVAVVVPVPVMVLLVVVLLAAVVLACSNDKSGVSWSVGCWLHWKSQKRTIVGESESKQAETDQGEEDAVELHCVVLGGRSCELVCRDDDVDDVKLRLRRRGGVSGFIVPARPSIGWMKR